jgi:hypothetical protein
MKVLILYTVLMVFCVATANAILGTWPAPSPILRWFRGLGAAIPLSIIPLIWAFWKPAKERTTLRDYRNLSIGIAALWAFLQFSSYRQ